MSDNKKDEGFEIVGQPKGEPIGRLHDLDGNTILIRSDNPVDLMDAALAAIGPLPKPPDLGLGGVLEISGSTDEKFFRVPQYTYNPAGDVINQQLVAGYTAKVQAWNQRATAIQAMVQSILDAKKSGK